MSTHTMSQAHTEAGLRPTISFLTIWAAATVSTRAHAQGPDTLARPVTRAGQSTMSTPGAEPAGGDTQTPSVQDVEAQVLLRLEDDWALGLTHRDAALFRRLLANGFVYSEDDRTVGRDEVLRDIVAGPDTVETAHNEDMKVHRFGTTAVVTGWLLVAGHGPKGPFSHRYRFTDTWVRREGRWQIVAAHDYLVPAR